MCRIQSWALLLALALLWHAIRLLRLSASDRTMRQPSVSFAIASFGLLSLFIIIIKLLLVISYLPFFALFRGGDIGYVFVPQCLFRKTTKIWCGSDVLPHYHVLCSIIIFIAVLLLLLLSYIFLCVCSTKRSRVKIKCV